MIAVLAPATLGAVFGVISAKPFWSGVFTPVQMVAPRSWRASRCWASCSSSSHRLRLADHERALPIALPSVRLLMGVGLVIVSVLLLRLVLGGLLGEARGLRESTEALMVGPLARCSGSGSSGGWPCPPCSSVRRWPGGRLDPRGRRAGAGRDPARPVPVRGRGPDRPGDRQLPGTISHPYAMYLPSPVEIALLLGAGAFMALGYTLAERYLDMGESDTHRFFPFPWIRHRHADDEADHEAVAPAPVPAPAATMAAPAVVGGEP